MNSGKDLYKMTTPAKKAPIIKKVKNYYIMKYNSYIEASIKIHKSRNYKSF